MPQATPSAVLKQIQSGAPGPLYLLQGEDEVEKSALASEFAALVEDGLQAFNVERLHVGDATTGDRLSDAVASIITAARTLPMMSPRRVVTVLQAETLLAPKRESEAGARALEALEAYVESPEPQTVLVLVAASIDRRSRIYKLMAKHATVVECGMLEDVGDAERWVRNRTTVAGMQIEPKAARLLAERAGPDVKRLRGDVDRLLLYALGQKTITVDDVREVAGPAALQDEWAITNAIEQANGAEALRQLALVLDAGAAPEKVLGQLGWLVRSKFPMIAPGHLVRAVESVFQTDVALKSSGGEPRVLLERLVVELCSRTRR